MDKSMLETLLGEKGFAQLRSFIESSKSTVALIVEKGKVIGARNEKGVEIYF